MDSSLHDGGRPGPDPIACSRCTQLRRSRCGVCPARVTKAAIQVLKRVLFRLFDAVCFRCHWLTFANEADRLRCSQDDNAFDALIASWWLRAAALGRTTRPRDDQEGLRVRRGKVGLLCRTGTALLRSYTLAKPPMDPFLADVRRAYGRRFERMIPGLSWIQNPGSSCRDRREEPQSGGKSRHFATQGDQMETDDERAQRRFLMRISDSGPSRSHPCLRRRRKPQRGWGRVG